MTPAARRPATALDLLVTVTAALGVRRRVRRIGLALDEPDAFVAAVGRA